MRISNFFLKVVLASVASALFSPKAMAVGTTDGVALQYHFAGAADLAGNTNFEVPKKFFSLPPARNYQDLVLDRLAGVFWKELQLGPAGDPATLLRPMLNDLLQVESMGSFGGRDKDRMDFVLAARLDEEAAAWQTQLEKTLQGKGEPLTAEGCSGQRWPNGFWLLRARDWTVAGRGESLQQIRSAYLQKIKSDNRPGLMAKDCWLSAEVDWPFLASWTPLEHSPLKLGRTKVDVTAGGGNFHTTAYVTYPEAMSWESKPWHIPKDLISGPISSFTAAQNLAAYLQPNDTLAHLGNNPLSGQLYCWAMREMALQSYAAWPVTDGTNTLRTLGAKAPALLNPLLHARNLTELAWKANEDKLMWNHLQLTSPTLEAAHDKSGDFLLAKLFPMESKHVPVSDQLFSQFELNNKLVYYDFELSGLRLLQWRLLTEELPIFPPPTREGMVRQTQAARNAKTSGLNHQALTPLAVTESWLAELEPALRNTVTEVNRTSPTELTVMRKSQFLFTGLELVLLSHWLADAPVGPVDFSLLPMAKMSGMVPPHSH